MNHLLRTENFSLGKFMRSRRIKTIKQVNLCSNSSIICGICCYVCVCCYLFSQSKEYLKVTSATKGCICSEVVSLNVARAFNKAMITGIPPSMLRHYIKKNDLGCTGKNMRLDGRNLTCLHISRDRLPTYLLKILDAGTQ